VALGSYPATLRHFGKALASVAKIGAASGKASTATIITIRVLRMTNLLNNPAEFGIFRSTAQSYSAL
jgi:hypothetical protein